MRAFTLHKAPIPEPDDDPIPEQEPEPEEDPAPHPDPVAITRFAYLDIAVPRYHTRRLEASIDAFE